MLVRSRTARIRAAALVLATLTGCREELGAEHFATTRLRGVVTVGNRPVPGGFIEVAPAEGTTGNLRVAPIGPDGRFEVDAAPSGRVVVGLEQLPLVAVPTPLGPVEAWRFRTNRGVIRRTIPAGAGADLPIDLVDEATLWRRRQPGRPRRKKRTARPSRDRAGGPPPEGPAAPLPEPAIRVVYRDAGGTMHLDWPADRLAEAVADAGGTAWVDIEDLEGANNARVERMMLDLFHFHPLAVEDALEDTHVPRVDDWGGSLYLVVNAIDIDPASGEIRSREVDFFLGPNFVVSYHNQAIEVLERHRRNLARESEARLRQGSAHVLYRLLDEIVADFVPAIEHLDDRIDAAQDEVFRHPTPATLQRIFLVKRAAIQLHRVVIPIRELLNRLARDDYPLIPVESRVYFRDVYDGLVRVHDILESLRDLVSSALETYLSVVSNRTNDIMKALTVVNVMFLPLTFVVGFFGMNFFGPTLAFETPALPKGSLFFATLAALIGTPILFWILARRRGWL